MKMWLKYDKVCCIKNYKKLTCGKNLLHSLHGDFSGFYGFIFNLNSSKLLLFLMQSRTIFQILGPKKVSVPLYIVLTLFLLNSVFFLTIIIMLSIFHEDSGHEKWQQPILYLIFLKEFSKSRCIILIDYS